MSNATPYYYKLVDDDGETIGMLTTITPRLWSYLFPDKKDTTGVIPRRIHESEFYMLVALYDLEPPEAA